MKKLNIELMKSITAGNKCDRLERRYGRTSGHRRGKTYAKALTNKCTWTDKE